MATPQAGENEPMIMMSMQMGMHNRLQPVMTQLRLLFGPAFDRAFFSTMIPHHAGTNNMANLALQRSNDAHVLHIAQEIMMMQADEMHDFKD